MNANFRSNRSGLLRGIALKRGFAWGIIIIFALLAFEVFNFSTTQYALLDVLGPLAFAGIKWATILAIAFCGIDFAGIARLFTPEQGADEPAEVWYLFGAWLLAAAFNAILTWWGVSVAMAARENASQMLSASVISPATLRFVPVFVAIMVWLIRVLIIGTFSIAGDRMFSQAGGHPGLPRAGNERYAPQPAVNTRAAVRTSPIIANPIRPAPMVRPETDEPTYHNFVHP